MPFLPIGAIFGTGTNGAYVEKVENITKLGDHPARKNGGHMVVNCEWGGFNNTVSTVSIINTSHPTDVYSPRHSALFFLQRLSITNWIVNP